MARPAEQVLKITEFPGIDRASDGTVTEPNRFYEMKNLHPVGAGELQVIGGVSDESASTPEDLPGVGKILNTKIMKDAYGKPLLMAFFRPSDALASWTPNLSESNFTFSGSDYDTGLDYIYVVYVGPGGYVKTQEVACPSVAGLNFSTVTFTHTPGDVPDWVAQIDLYAEINSQSYPLLGSLRRREDGTFASSVQFSGETLVAYGTGPSTNPTAFTPDRIVSSHISTPSRVQRWYFGIAPHWLSLGRNKPIVALTDSQANFLTADVDPDNGTTVTMNFAYAKTSFSSSTMSIGNYNIKYMLPFAGITPEDLVYCGASSLGNVGIDKPISIESVEYTVTSVSGTTATISNVSGSLSDGDKVAFKLNGGTLTGLSDGSTYYIRFRTSTTISFYTSFDNYARDSAVSLSALTGSPKVFMLKVAFVVSSGSLLNSRNNVQLIDRTAVTRSGVSCSYIGDRNNLSPGSVRAIAGRTDGVFVNHDFYLALNASYNWISHGVSVDGDSYPPPFNIEDIVGCWVIREFPFSLANAHQLLPGINERSLSATSMRILDDYELGQSGFGVFWNPTLRDSEDSEAISCSQFRNRLFTANGDNILWYTNGYIWKATMASNGKAQIPQSRYVQAFGGRLVASGGLDSVQNSNNVFYVSEEETPFDWGATINAYTIFSSEPVNGLGVYSQNLSDDGFASFLVISKKDSLFVWDGSSTRGPQQLYYSFGFAGPQAFAVTDFGPLFVSRENIYMIQGDKIVDVGDEVKDIFESLSEQQLARVVARYHEGRLKIGYPSIDAYDQDCDREVWLEFRTENGELRKYISGPHALTSFYDHDADIYFGGSRDVRVSCQGARIYQRDVGTTDNGDPIEYRLVLSRLGLGQDHLRKLVTRVYLAAGISASQTLDLTLDAEDGSSQLTDSKTVDSSVATRQLFQYLLTSRFAGRINKLTVEGSTSTAVSIYDLSIYFKPQKRGTLRYGA